MAQIHSGGGARRVDLVCVTMPTGSFEVQGYSPPHCVLHPVAMLSTSSSSPIPCRVLHPVLHLDLVFSTFSPSSPPPRRLLHSGVIFSMSLWCHLRWCSPCHRRFTSLVAALNAIVVLLRVSLCRRCISLVVVRFVGHYAGVVFPRCSLSCCFVDCALCLDRAALDVADIVG